MNSDRSVPRATDRERQRRTDRRVARTPPNAADGSVARDSDGPEPRRASARDSPAQADVERLEAELARKDRRLQRVVARYERLLDEKDRRLAERERSPPERSGLAAVRAAVTRLVSLFR